MRGSKLTVFIVLVLTFGLPSTSLGDDGSRSAPTPLVEIDLGTGTLDHLDVALGPISASLGLWDRLMVGTYLPLWFAWTVVPGSFVANVQAKGRLFRHGAYSASVSMGLFYTRLEDLDEDGLKVRAWIWPVRWLAAARWSGHLSTTLELTTVLSDLAAEQLAETDTQVEGVALARSAHVGVIQRLRVSRWFTVWGRGRVLIGHSPVTAKAQSHVSETTRVDVEARANAADLTSGIAGVIGVHLGWKHFALMGGAGYGTWFLPGIYLPVGDNGWIGEADLYFRF